MFDVKTMCEIAGVSRSGFYKWRGREHGDPPQRRRILRLVQKCHEDHPSHGYRWVHAWIERHNPEVSCSAEYVRRCFAYLGIASKTRHKSRPARERRVNVCENLIFSTWDCVDRPRQVLVSDTTSFWAGSHYWEWTLFFDVFTKQILGSSLTQQRGWPGQYYDSLYQALNRIEDVKLDAIGQLEQGSGEITIIHTDQGSVYTSKAYNEIIKENNVVRSMSRPGKPTDNPVNESLNGWIKEELVIDFHLKQASLDEIPRLIREYIDYYNSERPAWSLGYLTPDEFYEQFMDGQIQARNTFANRELDPRPKYLRGKIEKAEQNAEFTRIGSSDPLFQ